MDIYGTSAIIIIIIIIIILFLFFQSAKFLIYFNSFSAVCSISREYK